MKYSLKPSQIVTTFGAYATAPSTRVADRVGITGSLSKQRHATDGLADEVIQNIRGRGHHRRGTGITEVALDPNFLAERGSTAHAHRQISHLGGGLTSCGFHFQYTQHGVSAPTLKRTDGIEQQRAHHISFDSH